MYGSYGYYSGNKSNLSVSANLYKPAGVVNTTSSYQSINGVVTSNPTLQNTSIASSIGNNNPNSLQQYTNVIASFQNIDYGQNPHSLELNSFISLSVTNYVPKTPTNIITTPGDGVIIVSFTPSLYATGYKIFGTIPDTFGTSSPIIVTGLTNDTVYRLQICANNEFSTSEPSDVIIEILLPLQYPS